MISQQRLKELVHYDHASGAFTAKTSRGCIAKGDRIGKPRRDGYIRIALDKRDYFAHRLAFLYVNGCMPDVADHINGDRSDNRICNLRNVSVVENARNACKKSYSKSRFKGISLHKKTNRWQAQIRENGRLSALGYFASDVEAAYAYDIASIRVHGEFGRRNFLPLA